MRILMVFPLEGSNKYSFEDLLLSQDHIKKHYPYADFYGVNSIFEIVSYNKNHGSSPSDGEYMAAVVEFIIDNADAVFFCKNWDSTDSRILSIVKNTAKAYKKSIIYENKLK